MTPVRSEAYGGTSSGPRTLGANARERVL